MSSRSGGARSADAIVLGLGAHGSAAALALARRGLRVVGLERFERGHVLGSSGGRSRIIRLAYFEGTVYVPLARASWTRWLDLEAETGARILTRTGGLYAGPSDGAILAGAIRSAREHGLEHEVIDAAEIARRWPAFRPADDASALVEEQAGILDPAAAIEAQLGLAERLGADLRFGARAIDWRPAAGGGYEVETEDGTVVGAAHLVIAAGAWTGGFVPDLALPLRPERIPVLWFEPLEPPAAAGLDRLPVWIMTTDLGHYYGFPWAPAAGLKVSRHHSGEDVDPDTVDREVRPADEDRVRGFIRRHLPVADGPIRNTLVCLYTNTPDEHFVVDRHPIGPGVAFASACSGHGFKFAPVLGEILADLAIDGATTQAIDRFRADRFASTG